VRTKRLDQIDQDKIALAYWLLAKQIAEDQSDTRALSEREVQRIADTLEENAGPHARGGGVDGGGV